MAFAHVLGFCLWAVLSLGMGAAQVYGGEEPPASAERDVAEGSRVPVVGVSTGALGATTDLEGVAVEGWAVGVSEGDAAAGDVVRLGKDFRKPPERFEDAIWQWYEACGISEARAQKLFPHFPHPVLTQDPPRDMQRYQMALERWTHLFPNEYEAFVNADELAALNPYYQGYVRVYHAPKFLGRPIQEARPTEPDAPALSDAYLAYELSLQNWYFVFSPREFISIYGYEPRFPDSFDVDAYRASQLRRARGEEQVDVPESEQTRQ